MTAAWKTVRVFISSTFRDMHAERDHLVKVTFPRLRQWCADRRLHLVDIDLRWGVTKEQADNGKAIDVCLQEIDGSRPFFVCVLGERYGWVPDRLPPEEAYQFRGLQAPTHLSITHLEIVHATEGSLARDPDRRRPVCSHAFFYFRRPESLPPPETLPADARGEYVKTFFEELPHRREQLDRLKQALRERFGDGHVFDYSGTWDAGADNPEDDRLVGRLTRLDEFGDRVEADLRRAIEREFREHLAGLGTRNPLAEELSLHEAFVENRTQVHVPRREVEERLTRYAEGDEARPLMLSGPPGGGKSSILAHWVKAQASGGREPPGDADQPGGSRPPLAVVARFVGASPASVNLHRLLEGVCRELARRFGLADEIPDDPQKLLERWPHFLEEAGKRGRLVLVLDSLDQLDRYADPRHSDWLPGRLPAGVRVVVSAVDGGDGSGRRERDWLACLRDRRFPVLRVPELSEADRRRIVRELPSVFCKTLDDGQVSLLLENEATRNPLFLTVALEELRVFGSFEKLPRAIASLPRLGDVGGDIDRALDLLFGRVLERLERETVRRAPGLVPVLFRYLASACEGLTEDELGRLLERKLPAVPAREREGVIQVVLRQVRPYLTRKGTRQGALVDFYHRSFLKAVTAKYLTSPDVRRQTHRELAAYFADEPYYREPGRTPNERKLVELPGQLLAACRLGARAEDAKALADLFTELAFLEAKAEAGMAFDLLGEFAEAVDCLPEGEPRRPLLALLGEALRADVHFIARHPTTVFQCLWNRGWWYDAPAAEAHYETVPQRQAGEKLSPLLETWRGRTARPWLRSHRPPLEALGGPQVGVLRGHGNVVFGVAFSPDGRRVASGSWDETVRVWDAVSGQELACLRGHEGAVEGVAFSPDGERLVSGAADNTVRLWRPAGGGRLCLNGHRGWVMAVACSPDGRQVASASWDGDVRVWDAEDGRCLAVLPGSATPLYCVAFLDGGRLVAAGERGGLIRVWDWASRREVRRLSGHGGDVRGLALLPDGRLASSSLDRTIRLWDLTTGQETACLRGHGGTVYSIAVTRDGRLVSGSLDRTVRVWDVTSCRTLATLRGHAEDVASVAVSPDGRRIVSGSWDWTVRLWDAEKAAAAPSLLDHTDTVSSLAFSPDGRLLASGSFDRTVRLWETDSGRLLRTLTGHEGMVGGLAFTADGSRLASTSFDGTVRLWETATGRETVCLSGHERAVLSAAFSGDGRRVVSGSFDGTVRTWDAATGAELSRCVGHESRVGAVAFSSDGRRIVSGSKDRTVRVWDTATGSEVRCLREHEREVFGVGFLPDGRVWSASRDGARRVWDVTRGTSLEMPTAGQSGWRAERRVGEVVVTERAREPAAWLPLAPSVLAAHPSGPTWAAATRWHVNLFTLESR